MHSSNEATQRYPGRHVSPTSKYQFFERLGRMVFVGGPAVKLHTKNVEVGTGTNGNRRQDQVTMGRVHSHDLLTTKVLVLLRFSIMHQ